MNLQGFVCLTFLFVVHLVMSEGCKYRKFTPEHTYCKPRNPNCEIIKAGLTEDEKKELVKIHNKFRSKVAMGQETGAGGLPPAADMRELEWDDEIAAIAQKHAERCEMKHDCHDCRRTDTFSSVGQNIAQLAGSPTVQPTMLKVVSMWYDEIKDFSKSIVSSFRSGGPVIGHFTQVIWSSSWKLGCGAAKYKVKANWEHYMLTCNYGPAGNYLNQPIYKKGKACSSCPKDTKCGESGLCKAS